jgi:hypothetical protein
MDIEINIELNHYNYIFNEIIIGNNTINNIEVGLIDTSNKTDFLTELSIVNKTSLSIEVGITDFINSPVLNAYCIPIANGSVFVLWNDSNIIKESLISYDIYISLDGGLTYEIIESTKLNNVIIRNLPNELNLRFLVEVRYANDVRSERKQCVLAEPVFENSIFLIHGIRGSVVPINSILNFSTTKMERTIQFISQQEVALT